MDEPRILTEDETYLRRAQQASHIGPKTIDLCAWRDCPNAADYGPFCANHRQPTIGTATLDLDKDQLAAITAQVEADAAPLFVIAMNWIARQELTRLGVTLDSLGASIDRIRGELGEPA